MFRNFIKVALRNLWKNKTFSFINIFGLSVGLCCFLLIVIYVTDELGYDRYNANADRIYRINSDIRFGGNELHLPVTSDMMGSVLKKDYPEVENYTRIYTSNGNKLIKKGTQYINEDKVAHVDSTFFNVFTLPAISGVTHTALNEPNTVVVSETGARKYFGTTDVLGQTIETNENNKTTYKITAVIKDIPEQSHFHFDFLFSMKNVDYGWGQFLSHNFHTYLLLRKGTDPIAFEKKFTQYIDRYVMPEAKSYMSINSMDEFRKAGNALDYSLVPLTSIHLYSKKDFELSPSGNIQYIYIFSAIALFILLIACINFMNLTTAKSANRAKEVGIRKVLGTERKRLVLQFLSESVLMALLSIVIALLGVWLLLPYFNNLANKHLHINSLLTPVMILLLVLTPLATGALAGSYPAFYLSSFRPIEVLKGKLRSGSKHGGFRSAMVVFQFTTAIILIIGTVVVYRQLHFIQNTNLGYSKDQVLVIDNTYALGKSVRAFKEEMEKRPGVLSATSSSFLPVSNSSRNDNSFSKEAVMDAKNGFNMQTWDVDYNYLKTMGMEIQQGRNFDPAYGTDSTAVVINEKTAQILGYKDPVGQKIYSMFNDGRSRVFTIIGVVRNFNFESLHKAVGPLAFFLRESTGSVSFKIKTAELPSILKAAETNWKAMAPAYPFSYRFLDDSFNEMYKDEQRVGKIALTFSILAIFIACLGLFGLSAYIAEQRTKEIGIRKVLGASVQGLVHLLSKDFVRLVLISFIIATPIAWFFMGRWLQDFAYRINISWWIFILAAGLALVIAIATISFQAIRAALSNPVKNLRTE